MAFDWVALVRGVHILAAGLWLGATVFMLLMIMPVVRSSGPVGKQFMAAAIRAGGFGRYFGPAAVTTVVLGAVVYWQYGYGERPFDGVGATLVTLGALLGLLALLEGFAVTLPTENKLKALVRNIGPQGPTSDQAAELDRLGMKMGKASARGAAMILLAFLFMVGRTVF